MDDPGYSQVTEMMMACEQQLENLLGGWSGINQLWLSPSESAYESKSTALVSILAQGQFVSITYTWAFEGEPNDGLIIYRSDIGAIPSKSIRFDSRHKKNAIMLCDGIRDYFGMESLGGSYAAPPDSDWGWRIEIENPESTSLPIRMINVSPEGQV